jgi:hypothetical protein
VANPALSGAVEAALAGLIDPAVELRETKQSRIYLLLVAADRLFPDLAKALRSRLKAEREAGMMGRLSVLVHA